MGSFLLSLLLPAISGALLILAFPDFHLFPLSFVYLVPLFLSLRGCSCKRAALNGAITGITAFSGIFHWITYTTMVMSDFPLPLALLALLLFSVASGGIYVIFSIGATWILSRYNALRYLLIPSLFVLIEYLYPLLFPVQLGNTFYKALPLIQVSDITGVYGLSFLAVAGNLLFYEAIVAIREKAFPARKLPRNILIYAACLASVICYGLWRLADVESSGDGKRLNALVFQPNVTLEEKKNMTIKRRKDIFDRLEKAIVLKIRDDHDLAVLPEGGFPFFFAPDAAGKKGWKNPIAYTKKLIEMVKKINKPLITGAISEPFEKTRNSAVLINPDGRYFIYDKMKLLAFGEYMPFSDVFPFLKGKVKEVADMEEGGRYGSVTVRDMKIFLSICYEAILPTFTRKGIRETGADMIVNLTNDGWFGPDEAPEQHLMVQAQRAVELRVPLLRATNTGISALVDQTGGVTYRSTPDTEETMTVEITAKPLFSFYREYGDIFVFLTFLASLAAVLLKSRL